MGAGMTISIESSQVLALQAVAWLVGNDTLCSVFLGATGANETDLRERIGDPEFLGSVLDFLLLDDSWVIGFCDQHALPYNSVMQARSCLPGGDQMHWT